VKRTIALTRARDEAERSAALLAERGFTAVIAPVIETRATGAAVPVGPHDAVVATSAKALAGLSEAWRATLSGVPLYVVGSRTARAAADFSLALANAPALDVAGLIEILRSRLAPASRVLYLAGQDRRSELESALAAAGHDVDPVEIYAAVARIDWTQLEAEAVVNAAAVLHYSQRSAALAVALAERAGVADRFRTRLHLALSREAASPLRSFAAPRLFWPSEPREDALFDTLESVIAEYATGDA